ncbi:MAG TPA: hypothetical protein VFG54_01385 [Prolixibacteraceae bacterium]|nr:hypothetical protein [Prolixibacteraceae bacterium]
MNNSDYDPETRTHFYDLYTTYSDQQIKTILKNHHDYQESAVTAAIKIAIERELIHSDQDLMAPEYQNRTPRKLTAFPEIPDAYQYKKVVASIFRVLFLVSFIPIVFGIMKYAEGQLHFTYMGLGLGILWLTLTFVLRKTRKLILVFIQMMLLLPISVILGVRLTNQKIFPATDMLVLVILTFLVTYFLLYLKKLIQTNPEEQTE